jgi:hypothetical protein
MCETVFAYGPASGSTADQKSQKQKRQSMLFILLAMGVWAYRGQGKEDAMKIAAMAEGDRAVAG